MKQGVRIQAATKATMAAVVYDLHSFMALQETGGKSWPIRAGLPCR